MKRQPPRTDTLEAVFEAVKRYANGSRGYCFATNETLGKETDLSVSSVRNSVHFLVKQKKIRIKTIPHPRGVERQIYIIKKRGARSVSPPA